MALPVDLTTVRVTGSFVDAQGASATGIVTFTLSSTLTDRNNKVLVVPTPIAAVLVGGSFAVDLPATDDPDLTPRNNYYTVTIAVTGLTRTFIMIAPYLATSAIDLSSVLPVLAADPNPIYLQLRLDSLTDLNLSGLADGYTISYDGTAHAWKVVPSATSPRTPAVLLEASGIYPPRPAGLSVVIFEGPDDPTSSAFDGDVWIQTP